MHLYLAARIVFFSEQKVERSLPDSHRSFRKGKVVECMVVELFSRVSMIWCRVWVLCEARVTLFENRNHGLKKGKRARVT